MKLKRVLVASALSLLAAPVAFAQEVEPDPIIDPQPLVDVVTSATPVVVAVGVAVLGVILGIAAFRWIRRVL